MSNKPETVIVKTANGDVIVNKGDEHLYEPKPEPKLPLTRTRKVK
jgi:hypothetical protein